MRGISTGRGAKQRSPYTVIHSLPVELAYCKHGKGDICVKTV